MWTSYAGVRCCLHGTESTLWSPLNRIIILHTLIIRINIFLWWFKSRDVAVFFYWLMLIIIANILEKNARNFSQHFAFSIHILTTVLWCRHCYYSHFQRWTFLSKISQEHTPSWYQRCHVNQDCCPNSTSSGAPNVLTLLWHNDSSWPWLRQKLREAVALASLGRLLEI